MFKNKDKNIEKPLEESPESSADRQGEEYQESQESLEKNELTETDAADEKLRKEIENTDLDDSLKLQAQSHANDFQSLGAEEKIEKLLQIAKTKGIVFAVNVAKKMDDPYVLDTFHDALAKEGYYKKFIK